MSLFPSILCTISVFSLYGEYVVRSFLPNGVFLPCDHGLEFKSVYYVRIQSINQSINRLFEKVQKILKDAQDLTPNAPLWSIIAPRDTCRMFLLSHRPIQTTLHTASSPYLAILSRWQTYQATFQTRATKSYYCTCMPTLWCRRIRRARRLPSSSCTQRR